MEAIAASLVRPAAQRYLTGTPSALKHQIRSKATAARTKRALNIPPHPSFLTPDSRLEQDTIVFNPPSSSTSVYHTPFKFLPKTDPRRRANLPSLFESHFGSTSTTATLEQMPNVRLSRETKFHQNPDRAPITKAEVEEMRALRISDPYKWSVRNLSAKFDMPMGFVMACCQAPKEKIDFERRKMELIQKRWSPSKKKAMEERQRKAEMLARGEI